MEKFTLESYCNLINLRYFIFIFIILEIKKNIRQ